MSATAPSQTIAARIRTSSLAGRRRDRRALSSENLTDSLFIPAVRLDLVAMMTGRGEPAA
jgi:hypothetical protein